MKVVTLLGSARKRGNTATALGWVEEALRAEGHTVERIYLDDKEIAGCLGCAKCKETPDAIACVRKDDAEAILTKMIEAEAVLFTSPAYFWGFSGQLKMLVDRSYSLVTQYHQPGHTSLLEGQRQGLLVTGAGAYDNNVEPLFTAFDRLTGFFKSVKAAECFIGQCTIPDAMPEGAREKALALAKDLVG